MDLRHSHDYYGRAGRIPGRSLTRSKAPGKMFDVGAGPMYARSAEGAVITDADGNEFIDTCCALGAVSLGYGVAPPAERKHVFSLPHVAEVHAAEAVLKTVAPWATHVRFTKTGSEATHAAYRIAKRATGRRLVLVGDWAYHGWHEWCDDKTFPWTLRFAHGCAFRDEKLTGIFTVDGEIHGPNEFAAVFIEPHRWEPVSRTWLQYVREWCTKHGVLLVMDEMIYGARFATGGATAMFGVQPDLACFGKAIGNGAAVACVVGRDVLEEHGEVASGTYSGDAAGLAAVCDTLRAYSTDPVLPHLHQIGIQLQVGLDAAIARAGWGGAAVREGAPVHQRIRFLADDPQAPALGRRFAAGMASRGVLWHPAVVNVCYAHSPEQVARVCKCAGETLAEMKEAGHP